MTDNRTTEQCISKPLRGLIKHQRNRGYIDVGQAQWLFNIAEEIDAKHEQAISATLRDGTCEIALARLVDVAAKADIDTCAEILECVEAIRKAVKR